MRAMLFCKLLGNWKKKKAAVSIIQHICCISPKTGTLLMMSGEDVTSKLRKKKITPGGFEFPKKTGTKCQSYYQLSDLW